MEELGLYIHIPFCQSRCRYCDFNTYAGLEGLFEAYVRALIREITLAGPAPARTVYLGGGTPTVLPLSHLAQILDAVRAAFALSEDAEVTIEANPGTVDAGTLAALRERGVNRLSLGVQSFADDELRLLGRIHTAEQAAAALAAARQAGFENVSLDLIYGLPDQTAAHWRFSLERALALEPEHLSLYALSVEAGTPLARDIARGHLPAPDPDLAAERGIRVPGLPPVGGDAGLGKTGIPAVGPPPAIAPAGLWESIPRPRAADPQTPQAGSPSRRNGSPGPGGTLPATDRRSGGNAVRGGAYAACTGPPPGT